MEKAIRLLRDEVMRQPLHLDVRTPEEKLTQPEVKVEVVELADSARMAVGGGSDRRDSVKICAESVG